MDEPPTERTISTFALLNAGSAFRRADRRFSEILPASVLPHVRHAAVSERGLFSVTVPVCADEGRCAA